MSKQNVLVLGYVWPEPNSSAAGSHLLSQLTLFLKQGWKVTFASPAIQGDHKVDLQQLGIKEVSIKINCTSFDEFLQELDPTIVLFDRFMLEEQFGWRIAKYCPNALRILDTEDLHSLRQARHKALKCGDSIKKPDLNTELAKREVAAIFRCDLSLIISDYELELLLNYYKVPKHLLVHSPFMLEKPAAPKAGTEFENRQHFISIGNFRHEPNWDAVLWLKQEIWPLIRAQLPKVELHIYGAYPPPKATQLHNSKQGFLVKGWAQDSKQVMEQARVCLAPLRFGAGIKGKLAEAMMCGTPNITTQIGTEGMQMGLPWPGLITQLDELQDSASTAELIAENAIKLYQDHTLWMHCQNLGYELLSQNFDATTIENRILEKIEQATNNLDGHRSQNFIGQMLQHHHLKSTQYMAQWIEAKNRV
ncbi:glycosyltransferase family 4 protein [Paraglaciecola sp. 2405UD69-4]|uniref:glycosyltransferase family 4 protein n=1 Tax=Paraglaciecola sp. 2405UD69-4 TaxID=3391836 RepID=UPI0039C9985B